ncbi:MAG: 23S rRNA (adenine(2503)-C(2))-methyltransferase RlmN, partial [Verrucomicrobia bacterium]|nr:23S rRNA (adenine(2503)-C(2))-methyltransferase RlmN [Verrucomicrobiota bacterium]
MERLSVDSIFSQSLESLQDQFERWGEPRWRAGQLMDWIYRKFAGGFDECSNLSKTLRAKLKENYSFYCAPLVTVTGQEHETRKFLWKLEGGDLIESVLIPAGHEDSDRQTLCVSTQVGCPCGCK